MKPLLPALLLLIAPATAHAVGGDVGGYLRLGTRPDFQGGDGRLGYWNLYGRLLNEGPWATLDLRLDLLEQQPGTQAPWTSVHMRVEGGSLGNADSGSGGLDAFRISQAYVQAGNVLLDDVIWQVGTLDFYFGDLGLYDMRPTEIFYDTMGASAMVDRGRVQLLLGAGDSGYNLKLDEYSTVLTGGGALRLRLFDGLELGIGGQANYEPKVVGNRFAPHQTPDVDYQDWLRGQVVLRYAQQHPNNVLDFPNPVPTDASSYKAMAYLGFGGFGPVIWNNAFLSYSKELPQGSTTETYDGVDYTIYVASLTDQRTALLIGDEIQLHIVPGVLDLVASGLYGDHRDGDNNIAPSDYDRRYWSTVTRLQAYATQTVHLLAETSYANEWSRNGNRYREHADSIFANTGGVPDTLGLETGDSDTRRTWQGKAGVVLSPMGRGVFTRPSLRLLYGLQYSNQNNAFGNSFVETLDQYSDFQSVEQHWHHVVAIETEAWF
ncbi:MAG: carbohydrate porin [Oligoflexia bacterium]|nr:carbohydrate porin [Oligoflexia bacterium]